MGACNKPYRECDLPRHRVINHKILLDKLKWYGIADNELNWFRNYLHDRKQCTYFNGCLSKIASVATGVPQGSVLGPVLFLIFVNDLSQNIGTGSCNLFADDAILFTPGATISEVNSNLQACTESANDWYNQNKLAINVPKSNVMGVSSRQKDMSGLIAPTINNQSLNLVDVSKYLGVFIDKNLIWDMQVNHVTKQVSPKLFVLRKLRNVLPGPLLDKVYNSCIQPHIEYACTVWGDCIKKQQSRIQRLQNQGARIVSNNFDFINHRGEELVKGLNWLPFEKRFKYLISVQMFKVLHGMAPSYLTDVFTLDKDIVTRQTRQNEAFHMHVPQYKSEYFHKSLTVKGPQIWNQMPTDIRSLSTLEQFKKHSKNFFRES